MTTIAQCDVCGRSNVEPLEIGEVTFNVSRYDMRGFFDSVDACSPSCLAAVAVASARDAGITEGHFEARTQVKAEPTKRNWWSR